MNQTRTLRLNDRMLAASIAWILPLVLLASCGGGGGGGDSNSASTPAATAAPTVDQLANICTPVGEKAWELAHLNDVYLFYRDIVPVDPTAYATPEAYFNALIVPSKDRFSFVEPQSVADAFFNAGQDIGYGGVFKLDTNGRLRIGFVDAGGPLALQNVARGAEITTVAGIAVASLSTSTLNAYLFPASVGTSVTLTVLDAGQTVPRAITVASTNVVENPLPLVQVIPLDATNPLSPTVGYLLFNDQIATSEAGLVAAVDTFRSAGVGDVVIDLRYNGGGFLYIASELAYMLGGNKIAAGATFEKLMFNDKHPEKTNDPANTVPFYTTTKLGQSLPTLNLSRVFVITAPGTCSASESIINGLTPFLQVIRIGGTTCGKPYGFIQTNNCGDAYFAIQFQGVNNVGFGDYPAGFAPTCAVADDFSRALGDRNEGRLAATLSYALTGSCPAVSASAQERLQSVEAIERLLGRPERQRRLMR
ncbi:MAG: S41 family peptidase [Burkholderiaceae bacterium]